MSEPGKPSNGPTGREWGEITATLRALGEKVDRLDRDVREYARKADALEIRFATIRERMFAVGAIVAVASGLGGGVVNEHWPKIAMKEARNERPDTEREKPLDLAAYHPHGRYSGLDNGGDEPPRQ